MRTISCWEDISSYGVIALTGEACGLGYRILCDVTANGKTLLEKVLGIRELRLAENWNRGTEAEPHVGSVMLVPEILTAIGVFALLDAGCREVWMVKGQGLVGIEPADDPQDVHAFKTVRADDLGHRFGYFGTAGDRNVHVMSGRVL